MIFFDATSGVSGDMFSGAMIDIGVDFDRMRADILALNIDGVDIARYKTVRGGVSCTKFEVIHPNADQPHRHLADVVKIITSAAIDNAVKQSTIGIFELIAAAEAKVHGADIEHVHFHEVGAIDSIVDIVSAASAFHQLGDSAVCSPINTGSGTVKCAHGIIPVPAPATLELLSGMSHFTDGTMTELATPTGVAILKYFCGEYGATPPKDARRVGYGAGTKEFAHPNVFKVML